MFISPDEEQSICHFQTWSPLERRCTSGIVQRDSPSLQERSFSVVHETTCAPVSSLGTQTLRQPESSCTIACADLQLRPTITTTCAEVIRRSSLIKASALWMCSSVVDVNGQLDRPWSVKRVYSSFKASHPPFIDSRCVIHTAPTSGEQFHSHYPQKAHYDIGAIAEWSVPTSDLVASCHSNERWKLHTANYPLSYAHPGRYETAPHSVWSFYRVISKLYIIPNLTSYNVLEFEI